MGKRKQEQTLIVFLICDTLLVTFAVDVTSKVFGASGAEVTRYTQLDLCLSVQPMLACLLVCFLRGRVGTDFLASGAGPRLVGLAELAACSRCLLAMHGTLYVLLGRQVYDRDTSFHSGNSFGGGRWCTARYMEDLTV